VHGRKIASIAAAIGREFPVALLVVVSGLTVAEVGAGVRELLDAEVMTPGHSPFGEAVSFRHMLLRDAAYGLLLRRERASLHARIADSLSTSFPAIAEALPNVMAIQRFQAGMFEEAGKEWIRAGKAAAKRSAYSEAVDHFSKAIEAIVQCPDGNDRLESELAARLELMGALIAARGFSAEGVGAEMERIVALSRTLGTTAKLVPALHSKWVVLLSSGEISAMRELAFQVRDAAAAGSEIDRLLAARMCATSLLFSAELRAAIAEYERFMALYVPEKHAAELRTGHSDHATMVMMGLAETYLLLGDFDAAERWRLQTIATARQSERLHDIGHVLVFAGCLHPAMAGRFEDMARSAAELKNLVTKDDLPSWRGHADLFSGLALMRRGEKEEGLVRARRGIKRLLDAHAFSNCWYILFAQACLENGRLDEAAEMLALVRPSLAQGDVRFAAEFHRVDAAVTLARGGSVAEARERLKDALALAESQEALLFVDRLRRDLDMLPASGSARGAPHEARLATR
jgi:tetratricopeptide (TPR) repeat protein